MSRFTSRPGFTSYPTWTPDGLRVAFGASGGLFWKDADGTGNADLLIEDTTKRLFPQAFSTDGKHLILRARNPNRGADMFMLELEDRSSLVPFVTTEFNEANAEISPDGRFLAYQSDETGQSEIYVRPFPNVEDGLTQVSTGGGTRPLWARDGSELFYVSSERQILGVSVTTTESDIAFGKPEVVVERPYFAGGGLGRAYDIAPDGERFLMLRAAGDSERELIFVQNWGEELKRLVPSGGVP
jgi:serine/threonine-protein kinase